MEHSFNVEIATKFGIEEAILLQHIYYWVEKNKANNKHFHDGRYWAYNSVKAFTTLFPYIPERTLSRKLKNLEEKGLIISANYNETKYDRTLWYTITDTATEYLTNWHNPFAKMANGNYQNGEPIPDNISSDNLNQYNNLEEKVLSSEDIIEKDIRVFEQNPNTSSKNLFNKNKTTTTDLKQLISNQVSSKQTPADKIKTKNSEILENLKKYIWKLDEGKEVKEAYCKWLTILSDNKKIITKDQLVLAIEYLNRETNEDSVKIEAIKLASMKAYRDFEYTIDKAKENIHGKANDFLHFGGKNKSFRKIEDIAKEQAEEFRKEREAHPEKYIVPEYF